VSIATYLRACLIATIGSLFVGGCIVTSAEDFPDEPRVPPVILDTLEMPVGSILAFNRSVPGDLRIGITVRDDNVDDELEVRARLSVLGMAYDFICPMSKIPPTGEPQREKYEVPFVPSMIRPGECTKVEVFVSSGFAGECAPNADGFKLTSIRNDLAVANFWIWETSGQPQTDQRAAQILLQSCETISRAEGTAPVVQ
jgi:hypothetical protein